LYPDELPTAGVPDRIVLLVDDGRYWFELRAAVWRGTVRAEHEEPAGASAGDELVWFRFEPRRVAAWDYGQLREDPGG
jgi:hypothetical protein